MEIRVNYIDTYQPLSNGIIQDEKMKFIHDRFSNYYDVIVTEDNPDIVFCDIYGMDFVKYNCIRVGCCVEEYAPNFNVYDYVISIFDNFNFKDRVFCMKFPLVLSISRTMYPLALKKHECDEQILKGKKAFCSFVQSNSGGADLVREDFFNKLSQYKIVDSGGRVLNNVGGPVKNKLEFEAKHKFSISFLNARNYTLQDRPMDAFAAQTIPIYWGNPDISKVYNQESFINCHDFNSFDSVVEFIEKVDNDDELYLKMLQAPAFIKQTTLEEEIEFFDKFLINIVENGSIQRSKVYWNKKFEKQEYYGRKKYIKIIKLANKAKPITKILFASKGGKYVKKRILNVIHKRNYDTVYKKIK